MGSRNLQLGGLVVTVLLHAGLVALVLSHLGGSAPADAAARFDSAVTIEASLAFKEVKPQSRQPQKQRKVVAPPPEAPKIDTDPVVPAEPEKPEEKLKPRPKPRPKDVDIDETLDDHRIPDEDFSSTGVDEVPKAGSADGSKWGTEVDAKGHPYAAELKGRIYSVWTVPSLETGNGEAHGCVKLDESGKIVDRQVKKKSGNANLDRSVELALKQAPDMDKPVPDELRSLITVKGICFRFTIEEGN
jgi:outer membrane biosynthesis protein TonB